MASTCGLCLTAPAGPGAILCPSCQQALQSRAPSCPDSPLPPLAAPTQKGCPVRAEPGKCPGCGTAALTYGRQLCQACGVLAAIGDRERQGATR